jgi:hypothetical protein
LDWTTTQKHFRRGSFKKKHTPPALCPPHFPTGLSLHPRFTKHKRSNCLKRITGELKPPLAEDGCRGSILPRGALQVGVAQEFQDDRDFAFGRPPARAGSGRRFRAWGIFSQSQLDCQLGVDYRGVADKLS